MSLSDEVTVVMPSGQSIDVVMDKTLFDRPAHVIRATMRQYPNKFMSKEMRRTLREYLRAHIPDPDIYGLACDALDDAIDKGLVHIENAAKH